MAINDDGNEVAVAYAAETRLQVKTFTLTTFRKAPKNEFREWLTDVNTESAWGNGRYLPTPIIDRASFSGYPFVRNMAFLTKDRILVSFFPDSFGFR